MVDSVEINNKLEEIKHLIAGSKTELQTAIEQLSCSFNKISETVNTLKNENSELKRNIEHLEKQQRKNNIVIFGLPHNKHFGETLANWLVTQLHELLHVKISVADIDNVHYLGKSNHNKRPLLVRFTRYLTKEYVLKNVSKLKGKKVSISHDRTLAEREVHRALVTNLKEARSKGLVAFIKRDKLHIGEDVYTFKDIINGKLFMPDVRSGTTEDEAFISPLPRLSISAPGSPTPLQIESLEASEPSDSPSTKVTGDSGLSASLNCTAEIAPENRSESTNNSKGPGTGTAYKTKSSGTPTSQLTAARLRSARLQGQSKK